MADWHRLWYNSVENTRKEAFQHMITRFNKKQIIDIAVTAVAAAFSVAAMLYAIRHFGLRETWQELVLNVFYISCLLMLGLHFFNLLGSQKFNYWCSVSLGITVFLRDIIFAPPLSIYIFHLSCLTLSVLLLLMLTYFYARKEWKIYSKRNLWMIFIIDMIIATLYNIDIYLEPANEYTAYLLIEIWIRPTLTYGLVACFVAEKEAD